LRRTPYKIAVRAEETAFVITVSSSWEGVAHGTAIPSHDEAVSELFYAADVAAHFADAPTVASYVARSVAIRFAYVVLAVTDPRTGVFAERLIRVVEPAS